MNYIHPSAVVSKNAILGDNVKIGPFCVVGEKVKLGNNVELIANVFVDGDTDIGDNTKIYPFASVGSDPQDLSYKRGDKVKLIIGKNNIIRENALINPGTLKDDGITLIGDNNLFMGSIHVAHDVKIGNHIIMANQAVLAGHVHIEDYAVIGGGTPIHQFVKIGEYAMIAGASAVTQDIPPYTLAEGNRAKIKGLNIVGLRRHLSKEDIQAIQKAYKQIFRGQAILKDAANEVLQNTTNPRVKKLCEFIINTKRGIPYERKR